MKSIGFIGVGGIGRPMAQRLMTSGFEVTVCDKSASALAAFESTLVRKTTRAADCAVADAIVIMVANDAQVRQVVLDPDGILAGVDPAQPPKVAVMSTVLPETVREAGEALAQKNVRVIDAPVSGGAVRAAQGTLSIMTGGDLSDVEALNPMLSALGGKQFHCGPLGAGEAVKILNNIIGNANVFLMTEVSMLAVKLGLDMHWLANVMEASSGRNHATRNYEEHQKFYQLNTKDLPTLKAIVDICRKDLNLGDTLARQAEVAMPTLDAVARAIQSVPHEQIFEAWRSLSQEPNRS